MRSAITPEQFRMAGIYLNGGRQKGWRKHLARLLDTPETTIASWATRSRGNARSIPGSTVVALKLLVAMVRQRQLAEGDLGLAAEVVAEQVLTLFGATDCLPTATELPATRLRSGPRPSASSLGAG